MTDTMRFQVYEGQVRKLDLELGPRHFQWGNKIYQVEAEEKFVLGKLVAYSSEVHGYNVIFQSGAPVYLPIEDIWGMSRPVEEADEKETNERR